MAMVPSHAEEVGDYERAQLGYEDESRETRQLGGGHCADRESSFSLSVRSSAAHLYYYMRSRN